MWNRILRKEAKKRRRGRICKGKTKKNIQEKGKNKTTIKELKRKKKLKEKERTSRTGEIRIK